jgi:hypothetical protein
MSPARLNKMPVRIILDIVLQPPLDWLGRGLVMVPVSSQLEIRRPYGAPWRVA